MMTARRQRIARLEQDRRDRALVIDCPACEAPAGECCDAIGFGPFIHARRTERAESLAITDAEELTLP